jgi:hypothetical protein
MLTGFGCTIKGIAALRMHIVNDSHGNGKVKKGAATTLRSVGQAPPSGKLKMSRAYGR